MKKLFIVLIGLFVFSQVEAKTLGQIRSDIRYKIGDSTMTVSAQKWSDGELNIRINDVQRNIAQYTRCIYVSSITTPLSEVREYPRPPKCISIDRVSFLQTTSTTSYKKLEAKTIGGLDVQFTGGWENNTSGRPQYYYERGNWIGFERPVSAAVAASTGAIKIDYFKYPEDMTSDSDTPFDGVDFLQLYGDIITLGVAGSCKQDENKDNTAIMTDYTSKINLMLSSLQTKSDQNVQHISIGGK
jgi:hypothetical protein